MRFPVFIEPGRSRLLTAALCAMHGAAAVVFLLALPLPFLPRIALLAPLAASLWHTLRPPRVRALRLEADGTLECVLADGSACSATRLPDTTVFAWLIVLRLELDDESCACLPLLPDHMPREEFRALSVWLRWSAQRG